MEPADSPGEERDRLRRVIYHTTDYETVAALDQLIFPDSYRERPEDGNEFWLAHDTVDEDFVGFASLRALREGSEDPRWEETVFLSRVGVLRSARGHRLQRRFIRARLRWARKHEYKRAITYAAWGNVASIRALVQERFIPFMPAVLWAGDVMYLERDL